MNERAAEVVRRLAAMGGTLGVAESLTGGLVTAAVTSVPGSSAVLRGGITAYATTVKSALLEVDAERLGTHGPVDPEVARQMAVGAARLLGATYALATTGVAGPAGYGGHAVGEVWLAAHGPSGEAVRGLHLDGDRECIRASAVEAALALLLDWMDAEHES